MGEQQGVILVTGANGLIGYPVVKHLSEQYTGIGTARHAPFPPPPAEHIHMDVTSDESVRDALAAVREKHGNHLVSVIHLVAFYDFSGTPSPKYQEITIRGTERLLRELQSFEVEQFVFSSTMLVHAPCAPGQRIAESWPQLPKWPYPQSKVVTEDVIRANRGKIPVVLLRIAGVYDDMCHSIPLAHQMQRIYERQLVSHVYPGDISHGQAFVHLDDVVDAFVKAVERRRELPPECAILIGEPVTLSYDELQRAFGWFLHEEKWDTRTLPKELAKIGAWVEGELPVGEEPFIKPWMIDISDDHYALDISRAREYLGWEPRHNLRDTIPIMVQALKDNPESFYEANKLKPRT